MGCSGSRTNSTQKQATEAPVVKAPAKVTFSEKIYGLYKKFDKNKTGSLSFPETQAACKENFTFNKHLLHIDVIRRAFHTARKGEKGEDHGKSDLYVQKEEFRLFLFLLKSFAGYYEVFDEIDGEDDNKKITLNEFIKGKEILQKHGLKIDDPKVVFEKIDSNNSGSINFREFCNWVYSDNLKAYYEKNLKDEELEKFYHL